LLFLTFQVASRSLSADGRMTRLYRSDVLQTCCRDVSIMLQAMSSASVLCNRTAYLQLYNFLQHTMFYN